jgi:predicted acetyltransferase
MKIELRPARPQDVPVLRRLMQLYLYDFAAIDDWPISDDGSYGNVNTIEGYWTDPKMTSYLVRVDGVLAGFVLSRDGAYFAGDGTRDISEFFILRRHRRRGIGAEVARRLFDAFPGKWEVSQLTSNVDAQRFWRRVIGGYTGERYEEKPRPDGRGVMQRFDTTRTTARARART